MAVTETKQFDFHSAFVLDDEPQIGSVLCKMLGSLGIKARHFLTPAELMVELKSSSPDLIFLDLALGQSDAVEVIHELEAHAYQGRVVLISGRDGSLLIDCDRVGRAHGLSMLPPLPKPFLLEDIRDCLAPSPPLEPELPQDSGTSCAKVPAKDLPQWSKA
jgi:DNA-binding NtrC family response regulator